MTGAAAVTLAHQRQPGEGSDPVGVIGDVWPVVAVGLYGVGALVGPSDPHTEPEPRLTDSLRADATALLAAQRAAGSDPGRASRP